MQSVKTHEIHQSFGTLMSGTFPESPSEEGCLSSKHSMNSCSSSLCYVKYLCLPVGSVFGFGGDMADLVVLRPDDLTLLSNTSVFLGSITFLVCDRSS